MATFMERLAFLQKVPTLMKATADDETPCPGYLFQDIGKISHESSSCGQCLLEYLLDRLQVESCHVKLKVLKIFVHLCGHGSNYFLTELRRNSTFIQQASVYSGPPDAIHGTGLYQKVRNTAQVRLRLGHRPFCAGMGSTTSHRSGMQGFGYSPGKQGTGGGDSLLEKIQKAAEVVASAVLPPSEHQGIRLHDNYYRAVLAPSAPIEVAVPACAYNLPAPAAQRCPGQVGGGWEETDSGNSSSHNSSQDIAANSRASVGSKSAGSQSGASRGSSGDPSERVEALQLGDCGLEMALISRLTEGSRVFLSREESQHFTKECSVLNCEVVLDLLSSKLQDPSNTRALCGVSCLLTSDLLSLEQMFGATQRRLRPLSEGAPGPVANKATKILRQFEALMGGSGHAPRPHTASSGHQATTNLLATSAHLDPLVPNLSAGRTDDVSPRGVPQPPNHPTPPSGRQSDLSSEPVRPAEGKSGPEVSELHTNGSSPGPAGRRGEQVRPGRRSLFSGMELVTKGSFTRETPPPANAAAHNGLCAASDEAPSAGVGSQPPSAFSFLNF
uniref:TEPSIN adaptor related protein complex 4 accessory protein n=1 Tax=Gasterosteus aculeatus aculeatus TaxID=481459 RepID=G3P5D5_GASAC